MTPGSNPPAPWLSIIGIGEDGVDGLTPRAIAAIREAEMVFGGARHLTLAGPLVEDRGRAWPTPFADGIAAVIAARGRTVCVLGSGDPMLHGVGATLARQVAPAEMRVIPAPSSLSLAAARMGWPLAEVETLSIHGRTPALLRPMLHPGARLLVLTSGAQDIPAIGALLVDAGFGASRVTLLEALGGPRETMRATQAAHLGTWADIDPLNIVAIQCAGAPAARTLPLTPGRADALFEHDGQISKSEVRATILALLAPTRGELLWDVGAGSGSIGIEWMLAHPSLRSIAIEPDPDRVLRIRRNALSFGVPDLRIVEGRAPDALAQLPPPDAIFVGGGATAPGAFDAALAALRPGGRIVASAVTLETEALLLARHAERGGSLVRIAVDRAGPVGTMTGWRPAMPVTLWRWLRPWS